MSRWTLFAHNGLEYGPVEEKKLIFWIKEKRASADDLVRVEGAGQWEIVGEVDIFSPYFKDRPTEAGRIKKELKNELLARPVESNSPEMNAEPSVRTSNGTNCGGCSFVEAVERLHEEKKVLEEKLAEEKS